jgi:hypothetical protein
MILPEHKAVRDETWEQLPRDGSLVDGCQSGWTVFNEIGNF